MWEHVITRELRVVSIIPSYYNRDSYHKDKTISRLYYLYNGILYMEYGLFIELFPRIREILLLGSSKEHYCILTWWCHDMETLNVSPAFWEASWTVAGRLPHEVSVMLNFGDFFVVSTNRLLFEQSIHQWFKRPRRSCDFIAVSKKNWNSFLLTRMNSHLPPHLVMIIA